MFYLNKKDFFQELHQFFSTISVGEVANSTLECLGRRKVFNYYYFLSIPYLLLFGLKSFSLQRETYLEHLVGDMQSRPSGLVNAGGDCQGRPMFGNNLSKWKIIAL